MASLAISETRTWTRWYVLGVLTLVYALNQADRFVMSALIEPIKQDLQLSDVGVGILSGVALAIFYVIAGLPIAALADRSNRRNIVTLSLALWSGLTALCGITRTYTELLLVRVGVGVGEAGGTAPSHAMLSDIFPPNQRAMALAIYGIGVSIGVAIAPPPLRSGVLSTRWAEKSTSVTWSWVVRNLLKAATARRTMASQSTRVFAVEFKGVLRVARKQRATPAARYAVWD